MENYNSDTFENEDFEPELSKEEQARAELEYNISIFEPLNTANGLLSDFVKEHKLEHFARQKMKKCNKISSNETRVYAILNDISIRKATEITRKFNALIRYKKLFGKSDRIAQRLVSKGVLLN